MQNRIEKTLTIENVEFKGDTKIVNRSLILETVNEEFVDLCEYLWLRTHGQPSVMASRYNMSRFSETFKEIKAFITKTTKKHQSQ